MLDILRQIARIGIRTEHVPPSGDERVLVERLQQAVLSTLGRALAIRQVDAGSCNGCELEIHALLNPMYNIEGLGIRFVASPRHADMLLVTGPVSRHMAVALQRTYDATPDPKLVVAVGECGCTGGIFGESYASFGRVSNVIPVDVEIPGCPPTPAALLAGILTAVRSGRTDAPRAQDAPPVPSATSFGASGTVPAEDAPKDRFAAIAAEILALGTAAKPASDVAPVPVSADNRLSSKASPASHANDAAVRASDPASPATDAAFRTRHSAEAEVATLKAHELALQPNASSSPATSPAFDEDRTTTHAEWLASAENSAAADANSPASDANSPPAANELASGTKSPAPDANSLVLDENRRAADANGLAFDSNSSAPDAGEPVSDASGQAPHANRPASDASSPISPANRLAPDIAPSARDTGVPEPPPKPVPVGRIVDAPFATVQGRTADLPFERRPGDARSREAGKQTRGRVRRNPKGPESS